MEASVWQNWLGISSGVIALAAFIPYIRSILRGQTRPNRASWFIWAFAEGLTFASYGAAGADATLYIAAAYMTGTFTVACLALRNGQGGAGVLDMLCLFGAAISLIPWLVYGSAELALYMIIFVDALAIFPTLLKSIQDPESEDKSYWLLMLLAAAVNLLAVHTWAPSISAFPIYCLIGSGAIVTALYARRIGAFFRHATQPISPPPYTSLNP